MVLISLFLMLIFGWKNKCRFMLHVVNYTQETHLAVSLRGTAATVLTNLHPTRRQNYEALTAALDSRFGVAHQTELNRMRLKARSRHRDETLADLAEDVERLVRLAYPEATEAMVEVLAKDQFVDALPEEDMRLRIRQNKPVTLRDALETRTGVGILSTCQQAEAKVGDHEGDSSGRISTQATAWSHFVDRYSAAIG